MEFKQILKDSQIKNFKNGYLLVLPEYEINDFADFKKQILHIGGKWKTGKGFYFEQDPTAKIEGLKKGELNYKKKFDFYPTPDAVCEKIVSEINLWNGIKILEPSAGQGAFLRVLFYEIVRQKIEDVIIHYCEIDANNEPYLEEMILLGLAQCTLYGLRTKVKKVSDDFLKLENEKYDLIVANPPFKDADIHIKKMIDCLAGFKNEECSEIVCILPSSYYKNGWFMPLGLGDNTFDKNGNKPDNIESEKLLKLLQHDNFTFYTSIEALPKRTFAKSMASVESAIFSISAIYNGVEKERVENLESHYKNVVFKINKEEIENTLPKPKTDIKIKPKKQQIQIF